MIELRCSDQLPVPAVIPGPFLRVVVESNRRRTVSDVGTGGAHRLRDAYRRVWVPGRSLFRIVSIETRTGCNFACSFCPVARTSDPRPIREMPLAVIQRIAAELMHIQYRGSVMFFCNNEPLLDERLLAIVGLFAASCPEARLKILTNGILLTPQLAVQLFQAGLDVLEINNYTDGRKLTKPVCEMLRHADAMREYDIRINMRRTLEILSNRAGTAPNAPFLAEPLRRFCALPFTDLNVVGDGQVTLCCFDALHQTQVSHLSCGSLRDAWWGQMMEGAREMLLNLDRAALHPCQLCDWDGFRELRCLQLWPADEPEVVHQ